jgi:hypothetical protein
MAQRRVWWGVYSDSLNKALIDPLAQKSPAGFLFSGSVFESFRERWDGEDCI